MSILLILIYLRFSWFWRGNKNLYRKLPWQILREFVFDRLIPLHDDTARVMNICKLFLNHIINYIIKCRLKLHRAWTALESTVQWDAFLYFNMYRNTCNCYAILDSVFLPWNCFSKNLYRSVSLELIFCFNSNSFTLKFCRAILQTKLSEQKFQKRKEETINVSIRNLDLDNNYYILK